MSKTVFILRGLPGSGKSHFAKKLAASLHDGPIRIVSADYFFEQSNGVYKFDKRLVGRSHSECMGSFLDGLGSGFRRIIVDNVNSQKWEYSNFELLARAYGYKLIILEINCPNQKFAMTFHTRNVHAVPLSAHVNLFLRWETDERAKLIEPWLPEPTEIEQSPSLSSRPAKAYYDVGVGESTSSESMASLSSQSTRGSRHAASSPIDSDSEWDEFTSLSRTASRSSRTQQDEDLDRILDQKLDHDFDHDFDHDLELDLELHKKAEAHFEHREDDLSSLVDDDNNSGNEGSYSHDEEPNPTSKAPKENSQSPFDLAALNESLSTA